MATAVNIERVVTDPKSLEIEQQLLARHGDDGDDGYLRFLADRQDHIIMANPGLWENACNDFAVGYLRRHGLTPRHRLLDFGCGTIATGKYLIRYLESQNYVGIDISPRSIEIAWNLVRARPELLAKGPALHHVSGVDFSVIGGLTFDMVWAQSVLTQCSPTLLRTVLTALRPLVKVSGTLFANFTRIETGVTQTQLNRWAYAPQLVREAAAEAGFASDVMTDWAHPFDYLETNPDGDTMVRLRLR